MLASLGPAAAPVPAFGQTTSPAPATNQAIQFVVRGLPFEFVALPAGEFLMGSDEQPREGPVHRVRLRSFGLAKYEVTVRQFAAFTAATGYQTDAERKGGAWKCCWTPSGVNWRQPGFRQSLEDPVVCLSWNDAVAFCEWLSRESHWDCRLPSEAEWEYACRAGTTGPYAGDLDQVAWYAANSGGRTHPVWQKPANAWGLHGLHGNGWEWCADTWHNSYTNAPDDGLAWTEGGEAGPFAAGEGRILRGGAWGLPARDKRGEDCRVSSRAPYPRGERCNNSGFRVALTLPAKAPSPNAAAPSPAPSQQLQAGGVAFDFVRVPAGEFVMGSEEGGIFSLNHKPPHRVRIGRGFYLGRTEVTLGQFRAFVEATGYVTDAEKRGWVQGSRGKKLEHASWRTVAGTTPSDDLPAMGVSWNDAVSFCQWLSAVTKRVIRLPSEAEWEYACRASGTDQDYEQRLNDYGWHAGNCAGAQPVARKLPNAWGLHDTLGNVAEWCQDIWHDNYAGDPPPPDGSAWLPDSDKDRVVRGGHSGCGARAKLLTAYARESSPRDFASIHIGFRIVCAEDETASPQTTEAGK